MGTFDNKQRTTHNQDSGPHISMGRNFSSRGWLIGFIVLGLLLSCCVGQPGALTTSAASSGITSQTLEASGDPGTATKTETPPAVAANLPPAWGLQAANVAVAASSEELWYRAIEAATEAATLAQSAITAPDWDLVAQAWGRSVTLLQSIPSDDPRRLFSQRKAREYLQNLQMAQTRAERMGAKRTFLTLGSDVLDEQVSLYRSYVATLGPPDILVLGSSRALQGIDPQALQQALGQQGHPGLRVYNFSVNGATAQVVSFLTRQLFGPDMYPKMVVWAGGSRAFNGGRFDRTFAEILASPGYASVRDGAKLSLSEPEEAQSVGAVKVAGTIPVSQINAQGFLSVDDQFNPAVYYRTFPRVQGRYDNAYRPFRLDGVQSVSFDAVTRFLQSQDIPLVFVNLPLSADYLDSVRLSYERQFQTFLGGWANRGSLILVDLLEQWRQQPNLFADPSHINRFGAVEVAKLIAADGRIPWSEVSSVEKAESSESATEQIE